MSGYYSMLLVGNSKHLSDEENDIINKLYKLSSSVAENDVDCPKKKHIRDSVECLLQKLLTKKVLVQR